jgi:hypothetical protein
MWSFATFAESGEAESSSEKIWKMGTSEEMKIRVCRRGLDGEWGTRVVAHFALVACWGEDIAQWFLSGRRGLRYSPSINVINRLAYSEP